MNLWPSKKGPYDPLTYDIRRTISVRIMLHGPWLEMRFPKRNLPLRRMCTDTGLGFVEKEILSDTKKLSNFANLQILNGEIYT